MKFSVIIPVYNVEKYLQECVDSVLNQSYQDFEIILVDDGSTDQSGIICDDYQDNHSSVMVIHQANKGVSAARNTGVRVASGEYLYFLDGDDLMHSHTLESFFTYLYEDQPDFVVGRMATFIDGSEIFQDDSFNPLDNLVRGLSGQEAFVKIRENQKRIRMGVHGVNNRKFILDNNLWFDETLIYSEDADWSVRAYKVAKSIRINDKPYYLARLNRAGSCTSTLSLRKAQNVIEIYVRWIEFSKNRLNDSRFNKTLQSETGKRYFYMIRKFNLALTSTTDRKSFFDQIRQTRYILKYMPSKFGYLLYLSCFMIGDEKIAKFLEVINDAKKSVNSDKIMNEK